MTWFEEWPGRLARGSRARCACHLFIPLATAAVL